MKKVYPRKCTKYQTHSSFDYQSTKARVWGEATARSNAEKLDLWLSYLIVGVMTGVSAFVIDLLVEEIVLWKWKLSQDIIDDSLSSASFIYVCLSVVFGALAALMTVYIGPGAAGSGTAELMAYLNGIDVPKVFDLRTFVVKFVSTMCAVASGLLQIG